jgi:hypothetical protein
MDGMALATTIVGFISPYLMKEGEAITKKAFDETSKIAGKLYETIKNKFSDDGYAKETLKRFEEDPKSESRKAALSGVIEEKIAKDPSLATELEKLIVLAKELAGEQITQTVTVTGQARTGNITSIGKVEGNIDIGYSKTK